MDLRACQRLNSIEMAETDFYLTVCDRTMHDQLMLLCPSARNLLCISVFCKPHMKSDSDSLLIWWEFNVSQSMYGFYVG